MQFWKKFAGGVAMSALTAAIVQPAMAQETTSGVTGSVTQSDGSPAAGAEVKVTDTRTGLTRTTTTTATGGFDFRNLNVGGPYTVDVSSAGQQPTRVEGVMLSLGQPTNLNLAFSGAAAQDVIVVTAQAINAAPVAIGPASVFGIEEIATRPAVNRDLKDIVRLDPRVYLDQTAGGPTGTDGIQCGGSSPRFNSLTVDGIGLNDGFGLNSNGYPTEKMPFPFDAVSQVSIELAPYDVQYGGFTGCTINAVTKSGGNKFTGSLFYDYTNDSMRGDTIEGRSVFVPEFDEKRYGFTIGGPIIPDRLFFFGAYEKYEGVNLFGRGPVGSGATTIVTNFTQTQYQQIIDIARTVYGIDDLGGTPVSDPSIDEKYLARLDWNISDRHRASLTYNYNKGLNLTESDTGSTNFEFGKHLYDRGAELKAYSGQLFSDWTDNFSTELRVAYNDVNATAACRDGGIIGEVRIVVATGRNVYFGCDDSRHFNDLDYTVMTVKAGGTYRAGDHNISFGGERQTFDIFNAFTQHTEGEFVFQSIADFQNGLPSNIFYGNASGTNNPDDTAAQFEYDINTVYLQDEFPVGDSAEVVVGLRYDWYTNSDSPRNNPFFRARNGFANTENLDGKGILQPRFGFNWDIMDRLTLRGGAGLFAGGNPNVWVSNSYSNDGVTAAQIEYRRPVGGGLPLAACFFSNAVCNGTPGNVPTTNVGSERPGGQAINPNNALWGIPTAMFNQVATAVPNSAVAAIDPDFQPSSEWKLSLGATYDADLGFLGDDYQIDVDVIRGITNNASTITNAALERVGTAPGGHAIYKRIDRTDPDCLVAATVNAAACSTLAFDDLILSNAGNGGEQTIFSASIQKSYDWGLDWYLAYALVDSKDSRSMTSSVAGSNFGSIGVTDINNPSKVKSNFNIPNRITMNVSYEHEWFQDFTTRISLFGEHYQSRPYSYSFIGGGSVDTFGDNNEGLHLLYVPTGPTDPNVVFCQTVATSPQCAGITAPFATQNFFDWADRVGIARGTTASRNSFEGGWNNKFDLRIEQEFPTGFGKGSAFVTVENIGNLINDEWGVIYESPFPQRTGVVEIDRDAQGRYVYRRLAQPNIDDPVDGVSFWTIKVGAKWGF